jgi:hypothetical protein
MRKKSSAGMLETDSGAAALECGVGVTAFPHAKAPTGSDALQGASRKQPIRDCSKEKCGAAALECGDRVTAFPHAKSADGVGRTPERLAQTANTRLFEGEVRRSRFGVR